MKETKLTIFLDPFHIQFLREYYKSKKPFFELPKGDDLEYYLTSLKRPGESDYAPLDGEDAFEVFVPLEHFEDDVPYCINQHAMRKIQRRIRTFVETEFHAEIKTLEKRGDNRKDAIEFFLIKYGYEITDTNFQRLAKSYMRWLNNCRVKKFRKKKSPKRAGLS